jgi:hypothetical protein
MKRTDMKRHPALLSYGTMTDTMFTVRDLPTTRTRLLFLASTSGQWRAYAHRYRADVADADRWNAYADYLASVGARIMRYALARQGVTLDTYDPNTRRILDLDL